MSTFRRRLMALSAKSITPPISGYSYLVNTSGTASLITDIPIGNNRIIAKFFISSSTQVPYITIHNGDLEYSFIRRNNGSFIASSNGNTSPKQFYFSQSTTKLHETEWTLTNVIYDGKSILTQDRSNQTFTIGVGHGISKIQSIIMYDEQNNIVANLVPDTIDGVIGLYDTISEKIYGGDGYTLEV